MLRSLKNAIPGNSGRDSLPGGAYNAPKPRRGLPWQRSTSQSRNGGTAYPQAHTDGSAAGIHTAPTLQQAWQKAPTAVKTTWISLLTCLWMVWMGYRWIQYNMAGILLECNSTTCQLRVTPVGRSKRVVIDYLSRSQLQQVLAVKTDAHGTFVTDQNIVLSEPYDRNKKGKNKKSKQNNYKGPDENGNYLSYAIVLSDKQDVPNNNNDGANQYNEEQSPPEVDLKRIHPYMERFTKTTFGADGQQQQQTEEVLYRLIPRRFGIRQSKRRVRSMIQKLESYIKRRRQKVTIREHAAPAWQGVLLMVFGCIGLVLTAVLGHFAEETPVRGPGIRRRQQQQKQQASHTAQSPFLKKQSHTVQDAYAPTTPSQYEVSTMPQIAPTASSSTTTTQVQKAGYQRNTTQVRKRPGN